jgi:hypothetical protein
MVVSSTLAMTDTEFAKVKVNDVVYLDFSRFNSSIKSMTGKVIDKGNDWALVYEVRPDGYWSCSRWNKYYITSILTPAPVSNDAEVIRLRQEISALKASINRLIMQIVELLK